MTLSLKIHSWTEESLHSTDLISHKDVHGNSYKDLFYSLSPESYHLPGGVTPTRNRLDNSLTLLVLPLLSSFRRKRRTDERTQP